MAYILCIESATTNCSVAIAKDGLIISLVENATENYSHAEQLHNYIEKALQQASLDKTDLNAIAVSKGPGSYTGLRIGVSAAKGMCFGLDIPLLAIPTLASLAQQVKEATLVIPLLDARRMEVYAAVYDQNKKNIKEPFAEILSETSFNKFVSTHKTTFIGNGVKKFKELVDNHPNIVFMEDALPSANDMAVLANKKYIKSNFENVAYFEPYYLKDFIAG